MSDKIWIAFLDEDGKRVEGYFKKLKETNTHIKISSNKNVLTIPYNRILKVKERSCNEVENKRQDDI